MTDDSSSFATSFDDPRITSQFLRQCNNELVLLGVVHDHPASVARVKSVLESLEPDVLALELPPTAISLYRSYASGTQSPPRFGGEMSAAIAATDSAKIVGIDAPNRTFLLRLLGRVIADRVPVATVQQLLAGVVSASKDALRCRLAATIAGVTSLTVVAEQSIEYDCSATDPPERQADHERSHVAAVQALLAEADRGAVHYRDETREACMIDQLEALREEGTVVAVVGVDHLGSLAAALTA